MPLSASITTRLLHQHEALPEIIDGFSEEQLKQRVDPDKWSAFEHIAHLAAYQPMFISRLQRLAAETSPAFERYVAEKDPRFPVFLDHSLQTLRNLIAANAAQIASTLMSWDDPALLRTALHPKYGLLTVTQWSQFYLLHEAHHLFAIFMLTQDLRAARV